jgi:hypothetical protein
VDEEKVSGEELQRLGLNTIPLVARDAVEWERRHSGTVLMPISVTGIFN